MSTTDEIVIADAVEADAWADMFEVAPSQLGLISRAVAGARLLIAPRIPLGMMNRVIGLGIFEPLSDSALDQVVAEFREAGGSTCWVHLSPAAPPALREALTARRFTLASRPSWAKVLRGREPAPIVSTPFAVREVGVEHADAVASVLVAAHEMPPPVLPWNRAMVGRRDWRAFAAFDGDTIVAASFLFQRGERAWLGLGGTLASHRRRGAQGALMARRIDEAIAGGARYIVTETGEPLAGEPNPSLANMLRCGFRKVASRLNYSWPATGPHARS